MKVLVYFTPNKNTDNFEGVRLRKSIKGALEIADVHYTTYIGDEYDVAHFISPRDESKINEVVANNIPVVISALYCESDPAASWLDYKASKDGKREIILSLKNVKILNKATLVLVPSEGAKELLINSGVTSDIEIISPGVNLSRFDFTRIDEKEIFFRYYSEEKNRKLVVVLGDYNYMEGISSIIKMASKRKKELFYYFGPSINGCSFKIKRMIKKSPSNIKFKTIPNDDIYRSALINASIFIYPGYKTIGYVSALEAMASKCQLVIRSQPLFKNLIMDGVNGYVVNYSETLTSIACDCLDGKITNMAEIAHKDVREHSLEKVSEKLKWFYQQAINTK